MARGYWKELGLPGPVFQISPERKLVDSPSKKTPQARPAVFFAHPGRGVLLVILPYI